MANFKYPQSILPHLNYVTKIDLEEILDNEKLPLVVVRRSPIPFELVGPKKNLLAEDCVSENVFNYSMNLLGGDFQVREHLELRQKNKGTEDWDGKSFLTEDELEECWEHVEESYPIYYKVEDLHGVEIPYKKKFEKERDYNVILQLLIEQDMRTAIGIWKPSDKEVKLTGVMRVNHAPTMMNYWHVTLDAYELFAQEKPLKKSKSAWNAEIRGYMVDYLRRHYLPESEVTEYSIPSYWYLLASEE